MAVKVWARSEGGVIGIVGRGLHWNNEITQVMGCDGCAACAASTEIIQINGFAAGFHTAFAKYQVQLNGTGIGNIEFDNPPLRYLFTSNSSWTYSDSVYSHADGGNAGIKVTYSESLLIDGTNTLDFVRVTDDTEPGVDYTVNFLGTSRDIFCSNSPFLGVKKWGSLVLFSESTQSQSFDSGSTPASFQMTFEWCPRAY